MAIDFNKIKALIFDFDLTLVDSSVVPDLIDRDLLANHSIDISSLPKHEAMGGTFKTNARKIKGFNSTDLTAEEIEDLMIKYAMTHYVDLKVCSQELLKKWHEMGLVLGIISGNTKEVIEQVLNNDLNNEVDFFEPIYETNSGRSKAGCLIDFTNRFKLSNDEVVYIGDHTNDIVAAKEAGVGSIAVLSGLLKREDFRGCDPDLIVDNIGNLDEFILLDEKH